LTQRHFFLYRWAEGLQHFFRRRRSKGIASESRHGMGDLARLLDRPAEGVIEEVAEAKVTDQKIEHCLLIWGRMDLRSCRKVSIFEQFQVTLLLAKSARRPRLP
jgi:hypothetical protein